MTHLPPPRPAARLALSLAAVLAAALCGPVAAQAQYADMDRADWKEDAVPPPPAYRTRGLIDVEGPRTAGVQIGIDPDTISVNQQTGIVRYVVVARGPSAVNAMYEGIRCNTAEYRVYARQVQGGEWSPSGDTSWKSMRDQTGALYQHPLQLAQDGLCTGPAAGLNRDEIVRALRTPRSSF